MSDSARLSATIADLASRGRVVVDGETVSLNPYYVYVKGLAEMRIGPPPGVHVDVYRAKRLREIRNGARLLVQQAEGQSQ